MATITMTVLARDSLQLSFAGTLIADTDVALDTATYVIRETESGNDLKTTEVKLVDSGSVQLTTARMKEPIEYDLTIEGLQTTDGIDIDPIALNWMFLESKVDRVLNQLPSMYQKSVGSVLRSVMQSIGTADGEIGGRPVVKTKTLSLAIVGSTLGTATYGTNTYGG